MPLGRVRLSRRCSALRPNALLVWPRTEHNELERELGRGGMIGVFLAHDRKHGRCVAVRILNAELAAMLGPDHIAHGGDELGDAVTGALAVPLQSVREQSDHP